MCVHPAMIPPERRSELRFALDHAITVLLAAMLGACLAFGWGKGFAIDWSRAALPVATVYGLSLARSILLARGQTRGAAAATAFLQMTVFTVSGVVLAYTIAAHPARLWDGPLGAADRALGVDWPVILEWLDRWPALILLLGIAYHSLGAQMIVAILALGKGGRLHTLRITVAAAILAGFVTILVSAVVPAAGNLFDPRGYQHLWPSIAWSERALVAGLRDGSDRVLDLSALMGIVSFPSYHATLAALFIWCARDLPRLRWPLTVWAALTIVATPVFGGHYAVEVVAGLLLAPAALAAVRLLQRRLSSGHIPTLPPREIPQSVLRPAV